MKKKYDIIWYPELDSTNNEAIAGMETLDNLSVIAAENQTAGRGQRGNRWLVAPGENLTFSIILKFSSDTEMSHGLFHRMEATDQFAITQLCSLTCTELLSELGVNARIKWPNDIYAGDGKLCGMLIENFLSGIYVRRSVAGIGINVNQKDFPESLPNPVSVATITGSEHDTKPLLERFMEIFLKYSEHFASPSGLKNLKTMYTGMLYRLDEEAEFADIRQRSPLHPADPLFEGRNTGGTSLTDTGTKFRGTIRGISDLGLLQIEIPGKGIREFSFKEISFII